MRGVGEGFAFLRTQPVLLMTFVVDIIAMVFAWPQAVFPELSQTRFADSPNSLGWLFAGISIGALVMGLTSGWVSRVDRQGAVVLGAIVVWAIAIIGFGLAPSLWLAVLCLAVAGAGDMVSAVLRSSMLQLAAPDEMRGRMQGVFIVVVAGRPAAGRPPRRGDRQCRRGQRRDGLRRRVRHRGDGRRRAGRALVLAVPRLSDDGGLRTDPTAPHRSHARGAPMQRGRLQASARATTARSATRAS